MCRWMAYSGHPVFIDELLFRPPHGLIDQSLHSRMGAETTNGDGFGLGWYGPAPTPGTYHSVAPAWGDANLRDLAAHIESPLFLAHVRATSGTAIQQTNCHPFRHGRWLFAHNGVVEGFHAMRRELMLEVEPEPVPRHPGLDGLRGPLPPRADLRPRARPGRSARAHDRPRRDDRAAPRDRQRRAGQHRRQRRRAAVGVPVLDRGSFPDALRLRGCPRDPSAASRERATGADAGRGPGGHLRADVRPPRRLERDPRVDRPRGAARARRAARRSGRRELSERSPSDAGGTPPCPRGSAAAILSP